jgi:hypothetical protein
MKYSILAIVMAFLATVSFGAQAAVKHHAKHHVKHHVVKHVVKK